MVIAMVGIVAVVGALSWYWGAQENPDGHSVKIANRPAAATYVALTENGEGEIGYRVVWAAGGEAWMSPRDYAQALYEQRTDRPWHFAFLNITSPAGIAWVSMGLAGQLLFTGRMVLQWLVSEKQRQSVVPPAFWWMSLAGASMLVLYFIWRRDAVGVLGQATGWIIYVRNLWLIYVPREPGGSAGGSAGASGGDPTQRAEVSAGDW